MPREPELSLFGGAPTSPGPTVTPCFAGRAAISAEAVAGVPPPDSSMVPTVKGKCPPPTFQPRPALAMPSKLPAVMWLPDNHQYTIR